MSTGAAEVLVVGELDALDISNAVKIDAVVLDLDVLDGECVLSMVDQERWAQLVFKQPEGTLQGLKIRSGDNARIAFEDGACVLVISGSDVTARKYVTLSPTQRTLARLLSAE